MTGKPGQTQLLAKEKEKKENVWRKKLFGHWAVLVVTWWYWVSIGRYCVSMGRYWLVLGDMGQFGVVLFGA